MFTRTLTLVLALLSILLLSMADESQPSMGSIPDNSVIPFENLAQNLPEAFSVLEGQFQDPGFKAMLTSQLNNPHAIDMFQSLIHDPTAVSSISALLDDPKVQSSLSVQFVQQFMSPDASPTAGFETEATNDISQKGKDIEHSMKSALHSSESGSSGRPRALIAGIILPAILGAIAPL
ncbi:hypothetical protein LPJ78_004848 [Coemansia sp. RSA 989]|nr:hypothetical protein BX667DRAFT_505452 [Coemansia mojavensis]KAJ1739527.1 hypothetical protein LPJ68_004605 [Coemansia sp. RSA 1086]KAJ1747955.1 hypothetical protein LPJ79_004896 [Coemansia sp. RSA 1821]KAJ1862238.1 hypothetical protein LPJ78_004848 [Coemansia sp. RSA 989]KAJ1870038.1 hypothetical protein LPJ55_004953 [Coemansia sp. RSA 990]KAJ2628309.1 hypothetical protein H4R22_003954 [Coemansia sp. RSA 1290]KAJ2652756.1 hypothetical protein IWW40_000867 [Coemansia sp. RSA 1250]KAJ26753